MDSRQNYGLASKPLIYIHTTGGGHLTPCPPPHLSNTGKGWQFGQVIERRSLFQPPKTVLRGHLTPVPKIVRFSAENRTIFPKQISPKDISESALLVLSWSDLIRPELTSRVYCDNRTVEWIHKPPASIFGQQMFVSDIWIALVEKEPWKVKPPL